MKEQTINTLTIARNLYDQAQKLCLVSDRFTASSGLVILQDVLELVFYGCLIELDVDGKKSIENFSFDQMIGELRNNGYKIVKSGTIKALNKQRVLIKHYGHVADPVTVRGFFDTARLVIDDLLSKVLGKSLHGIFVYEMISDEKTRNFIREAEFNIADEDYFAALINVRKAIYNEIEADYCIDNWSERNGKMLSGGLGLLFYGYKAPHYTKNKEWIKNNVKTPFDYVQLDRENIRLDLIEWGVSTQDFWNLINLTPKVYYDRFNDTWEQELSFLHYQEGSNENNARYCFDRAISIILKKQKHFDLGKNLGRYHSIYLLRAKRNTRLYEKASLDSKEILCILRGSVLEATMVSPSIEGHDFFAEIYPAIEDKKRTMEGGYVPWEDLEFAKQETEN